MVKRVQMNLRVPESVKDWIYSEAAKDDREPGWLLTHLVTTKLMPKKRSEPKQKESQPVLEVPSYIDGQLWLDFIAIRKQLKAPASEAAHKLLLGKLDRMHSEGHDPNEVIRTSIENGWKGVFPPKRQAGPASQSKRDQVKEEALRLML